ncbi:protein kinase [Flexivirga sp. ID2601S]|uniref:non-specific serine/threonine protein kinase n=1 Tax=Flexivirga aerilata TaxID=1656889 RepID=A0A849AFU3_9MICO|nr:protein kinase [Flexivirga aerilata]NNG38121.1 protein kinase [Flexivirga aerilata]
MQRTGGTVVGGRYQLTSRIAGGGMGEVWRATDRVLERPVAVKLLRATLTDDPAFLARFRVEARNAAKLSHGNIAQVHDYGEDGGTAFLVLELVDGRPLSQLIAAEAPLAEADAVHLLVQAATALHAAHAKGIVHRDVKPANIVVDDESTAKLTDFGIARALDASSMTRAGEVMGTPQYLAPEAATGKEATAQSDVYSLGVVAYELLVGRLPYSSDTAVGFALAHVNEPVPALPPTVHPALREVVQAAMSKHPDERPRGGSDFARRLQESLAATPVSNVGPVRVAHLPPVGRSAETTSVVAGAPGVTGVDEADEAVEAGGVTGEGAADGAPDDRSGGLPASTDTPQPARTLARGQNSVLSTHRLTVQVEAAGDPRVDLIACELDERGRAPGDDALVFYNQPVSGDGVVRLAAGGRIEFDTAVLPEAVHSVAVGVAIDPPETLGALAGLRATVAGTGPEQPETFHLAAELGDERRPAPAGLPARRRVEGAQRGGGLAGGSRGADRRLRSRGRIPEFVTYSVHP